jgi:hypothetical protein
MLKEINIFEYLILSRDFLINTTPNNFDGLMSLMKKYNLKISKVEIKELLESIFLDKNYIY